MTHFEIKKFFVSRGRSTTVQKSSPDDRELKRRNEDSRTLGKFIFKNFEIQREKMVPKTERT